MEKKMETKKITKRTAESLKENLLTCPGDVFTIKGNSNCISDSLTVLIENKDRDESFYNSWPNRLPVWKLLKQLNDMGGRKVFRQIDDNVPEPFEDSLPYKARFKN